MLITISNLFPRPDRPTLGMYNFRLFREMGKLLPVNYLNVCLVPEWRVWRWPLIRRWTLPGGESPVRRQCGRGAPRRDSDQASAHSGIVAAAERASHIEEEAKVPPFLTRYLPVFTLPLIGRSINWWFYCRALRDKALDSGSLYYVPWLYPDGVAVARTIRGRGARLWLMALGSDTFHLQSRRRRHLILEACKQAEGIVCVARVLADRLADAGVPREKLHVVPNGVDTALFRPRRKEDAWRELGWGEENPHLSLRSKVDGRWSMVTPPMILFVGNLVPVKGPDVMVRAFAELVNSYSSPVINEKNNTNNQEPTTNNPLPQLLLIGEGPMRGQLERLVCALGLAGRVHFLGRRVPEDVALWMNVADCLCLSSASEGMPNVVLEARASGLPVVATPAGACPELSLDKEGLLVVKSCWPEDIAEGLREMLGRDLGSRGADSAIPAWHEQAEKILGLVGR